MAFTVKIRHVGVKPLAVRSCLEAHLSRMSEEMTTTKPTTVVFADTPLIPLPLPSSFLLLLKRRGGGHSNERTPFSRTLFAQTAEDN